MVAVEGLIVHYPMKISKTTTGNRLPKLVEIRQENLQLETTDHKDENRLSWQSFSARSRRIEERSPRKAVITSTELESLL